MAQDLTERAQAAASQLAIQPQFVLKIDGIDTCFGAVKVQEVLKYGAPGAKYGDAGLFYGGLVDVDDQSDSISIEGTSTRIKQQLEPDKGAVSSVSSVTVRLLDFDNEITEIITPGFSITDALASSAQLYMGFQDTSFPEDFILIFQGLIENISSGSGFVDLTLSHPDQKKRATIFKQGNTTLSAGMGSGDTTIPLATASSFLAPKVGDSITTHYVRINDEIMSYSGISGSTLTGATRGEFGTIAVAHSSGDDVVSHFGLETDAVKLALSLLLSDPDKEFFVEGVDVTNFVRVSATETITDTIFFDGVNLKFTYGLTAGDLITTTGASNGANNVSLLTITDIIETELGDYLVVDGAGFVEENDTAATISFKSEYNTMVDGLRLTPPEVDVDRFEFLRNTFLSSFSYRFLLTDDIEGKDFLETQVFLPYGMYSVPRLGRSSLALHIGPLPTAIIPTLDIDNIIKPSTIKLRRTFSKNFYNTVIHKFDKDEVEDRYKQGLVTINGDSRTRIPAVGIRDLKIESDGMRTDLTGLTNAATSASRMLSRYKFGAEFFQGIQVNFKSGFNVDVADLVILDPTGLKISNTVDGNREKPSKIFEVVNRSIDLKTGKITLELVDTNFDGQDRFGLISPASQVKDGISTSKITIKKSFRGQFGNNEFRKWQNFIGASVTVRSPDSSVIGDTTISLIQGNDITFDTPLAFTPLSDYIMEMSDYDSQTAAGNPGEQVKLQYTFMSDITFADGGTQYQMI